jgi:anti-anti-sigma factor
VSDETLHVVVKADDQQPTLVVSGEVDLLTSDQLRGAVDEALADGASSLCFDLTGVTFMDSTGLGILAIASDRAIAAGGSVSVHGANPTIVRLLEVSRLDTVIDVA